MKIKNQTRTTNETHIENYWKLNKQHENNHGKLNTNKRITKMESEPHTNIYNLLKRKLNTTKKRLKAKHKPHIKKTLHTKQQMIKIEI